MYGNIRYQPSPAINAINHLMSTPVIGINTCQRCHPLFRQLSLTVTIIAHDELNYLTQYPPIPFENLGMDRCIK
jgi:hypothetical protein